MVTHVIKAGTLAVLSGLPGSGKTSLRQGLLPALPQGAWLSSDELREQLLGAYVDLDEGGRPLSRRHESANTAVFSILREMVRTRLREGLLTIVDATSLTDADRAVWLEIAAQEGVAAEVLILDASLEHCLSSNAGRSFRVPEHVILAMNSSGPVEAARQEKSASPQPRGFMRTSRFAHRLLQPGDQLALAPQCLEHAGVDVIGDVHGLYDDMLELLVRAGWRLEQGRLRHAQQERKLLFLGDLVDRGPKSLEVLKLVRQAVVDGVAHCLLGNHELKLLRFVETARKEGIERWTSYANAQTGMAFLQLPQKEQDELLKFLRTLPHSLVLEKEALAFVHADVHRFDPYTTLRSEAVFGQSSVRRAVDSDFEYQRRYCAGINRYTLIRGHIPQTSAQPNVFSLERQAFQHGELVLLQVDRYVAGVREGLNSQQAFEAATLTQKCDWDFEGYRQRYNLVRAMESLVTSKNVVRQFDDTRLLRVYKYSKQTFFNNDWRVSELLLKARGLVLDAAGTIVSHPFDKVFNYLENDAGGNLSEAAMVVAVSKLNGFLGIASAHPLKRGELLLHTQGSFEGEFVGYLREYLYAPEVRSAVSRYLARHDVTLMFEVLHPSDPHIVEYPSSMRGVHLLGVRAKHCEALAWCEERVDEAAREMGLRRPTWQRIRFQALKEELRTSRTEGAMVRCDDKDQRHLFKIKTPYYLTTKFLGRLAASRIAHMYGNLRDFKKNLDEEFYPIADALVARVSKGEMLAMGETERVALVRSLIERELRYCCAP